MISILKYRNHPTSCDVIFSPARQLSCRRALLSLKFSRSVRQHTVMLLHHKVMVSVFAFDNDDDILASRRNPPLKILAGKDGAASVSPHSAALPAPEGAKQLGLAYILRGAVSALQKLRDVIASTRTYLLQVITNGYSRAGLRYLCVPSLLWREKGKQNYLVTR